MSMRKYFAAFFKKTELSSKRLSTIFVAKKLKHY